MKVRLTLLKRREDTITDPEETTPGVAEFKYIQVKPDETLTDVLLRQHICLKVQHNKLKPFS